MGFGRSLLLAGSAVLAISYVNEVEAASITGRIFDSTGVRALAGAEIRIIELNRVATSEADGGYRFIGIPAGRYTLRVRYTGAETAETSLVVDEQGIRAADIKLKPAGDAIAEDILVIGQSANLSGALSRQRSADTVQSVLTRDAIGQFPDQNVAESIRRATGVNVLNDQGEGRFVTIRGLDPNLNATSINGARVPAPESDIRSVALDVLPAELVDSIEIKKSLTPDMDGDTIGGSVDVSTTNAFTRGEPFVSVTAEGSYNNQNEKISPKGAIDFSTLLSDKVGISGGLSYYRRKFATDNIEADGWGESDAGIVYADEVAYRDYDVRRTRMAGSLSFDVKAGDNTELYARGLYSKFEDQEFRSQVTFSFDEEPSSGSDNTARFLSDDGEIEVVRDMKDRYEEQTITSLVLGGKTFVDKWTFNYQGSYSRSKEQERGSLDTADFARSFEDEGELDVTFDYSKMRRPIFNVSPGTQALFLDPEEYEFDELTRTTVSDAKDEEWAFRFDVTREISLTQGSLEVQAGGKARLRDKVYDLTADIFDGFDGDFTLADVLGAQSYGLADIEPVVDPRKLREFYAANLGLFERSDLDSDFESNIEDFGVSEDIYAGYLLGRYDTGSLRIIAGARVEHTRNKLAGNTVELLEEGAIYNGDELEEDIIIVSPFNKSRNYTDWLPSLNVRYEAQQDVLLRLGVFRSVVRPNFSELAPRFVVEENDEGDREGEFGNPDLLPYRAWNLDLSAEWYFDKKAVLQAGLFYKRIKNFIVYTEFEDITFNGVFATEAIIPINGDKATVKGLEFNYQQAMTFLPSPFDGILVGLNYTYTDAEGEVNDRDIPLPTASKNTFNATLGYEKGPFSFRVAGTYRDDYLDELGDDAEEDRYIQDHFQVDISMKYDLTDNITLFADLINLNNAKFVAYQGGPGRNRLLQFERYSWTGKFGVKATF